MHDFPVILVSFSLDMVDMLQLRLVPQISVSPAANNFKVFWKSSYYTVLQYYKYIFIFYSVPTVVLIFIVIHIHFNIIRPSVLHVTVRIVRGADWRLWGLSRQNRAAGRSRAQWLQVNKKRLSIDWTTTCTGRPSGRDWRLQWSWKYCVIMTWWWPSELECSGRAGPDWADRVQRVGTRKQAARPTQRHSTQARLTLTQE